MGLSAKCGAIGNFQSNLTYGWPLTFGGVTTKICSWASCEHPYPHAKFQPHASKHSPTDTQTHTHSHRLLYFSSIEVVLSLCFSLNCIEDLSVHHCTVWFSFIYASLSLINYLLLFLVLIIVKFIFFFALMLCLVFLYFRMETSASIFILKWNCRVPHSGVEI